MTILTAIKADITTLDVTTIVNAANSSLLGGGGVDGAIHRAAGKSLLEECRTLNGCRPGNVKMTRGYNLPASHIIHAVGPVWNGGKNNEENLLKSCYQKSLEIAAANNFESIAFPSISTGVYRFPFQKAASIAINTCVDFIQTPSSLKQIIFCCFSDNDFQSYKNLLTVHYGSP